MKQSKYAPPRNSGFTLIELSIVLVIIGLVAGGVLVGRDLIQAAEERSVLSERDQFIAGLRSFDLKYDCLPGDCAKATQLFGIAAGTGANDDIVCMLAADTNRGATGTCNGTGNDKIAQSGSTGFTGDEGRELYLVWQHLALGGVLSGTYGGMAGGSGISYGKRVGYNAPPSAFSKQAMWSVYRADDFDATNDGVGYNFSTNIIGKNILILSKSEDSGSGYYYGERPLMNSARALRLDTKFDDGMPFTGQLTAVYIQYMGGCVTSNVVSPTNTYEATAPFEACMLAFPWF